MDDTTFGEPPRKRARTTSLQEQPEPVPADNSSESPAWDQLQSPYHLADYYTDQHNSPTLPISSDPFQSPAASWTQDGFSQDPGYLASQEELRCILFSLANSTAPTRVSSPDIVGRFELAEQSPRSKKYQPERRGELLQSSLSSRRRIEYLKNYVAEVAPWVCAVDDDFNRCITKEEIAGHVRLSVHLSSTSSRAGSLLSRSLIRHACYFCSSDRTQEWSSKLV